MQKVFIAVLLGLLACISGCGGAFVSPEQEHTMSADIRQLIDTALDSNGMRFLVPGIVRMCFHDCVHICDGCVDTRRKAQPGNNGLDITWTMLKAAHRPYVDIVSRADFFALACVVTSDFAGERGEQEGLCIRDSAKGHNDCRPNMNMVYGRRTCAVPQLVQPLRPLPDANQDPYKWFDENMKMTPREAICIMGSHALGKLRSNETGFSGGYTSRFDVLSNEFFKMMAIGKEWRQETNNVVVDDFSEVRSQWRHPETNFTRVNTDMMLIYKLGNLGGNGESSCLIKKPKKKKSKAKFCPKQNHMRIIQEMIDDNKAFIECFGDAMDKMVKNGYGPEELVPAGVEIPPAPLTTTIRPVPTRPSTKRKPRKKSGGGGKRRRDPNKRKRNGNKNSRKRNRLRSRIPAPAPTPAPAPPAPGRGSIAHLTNLLLS